MKLRATVPFQAFADADRPDDLSPAADFIDNDRRVTISLRGEDPWESPTEPGRFFRRIRALHIEVDSDKDAFRDGLKAADGRPVLTLVTRLANRALRAIRNYGMVAHVEELKTADVPESDVDRWLRALHVMTSSDGTTWSDFRTSDTLEDILIDQYTLRSERVGDLSVSDWPAITEAVQDDLAAGPEKEFLTNAIEHARIGNLRLAVLEIVICLEIVLSEWLHQLLPQRGLRTSKVKKLLGPKGLGLSDKLDLLLPLLLSQEEIKKANIDRVLSTVSHRNKIIHQTGNLPAGVPDDEVRGGIVAIITLVNSLAKKRDRLRRAPKLREIAEQAAAALQFPIPLIEAPFTAHLYTVTFNFGFGLRPFPSDDQLQNAAKELAEKLAVYDSRFQAATGLFILFDELTGTVAKWGHGKLTRLKDPLPPLSLPKA